MIYKYLQYVRCNENVGLSKMTPVFCCIHRRAGGLIGLGRCLAEITNSSVFTCHRTVLKYLFMHLCLQKWIIAILYSMAYRTTKLKSYSTSRMPLLVSSLFQENMNTLHLFC